MNPLSYLLRPAVRKGPRYSVRPFYATILVFITLAVLSRALNGARNGRVQQSTAAAVSLFKREDVPEVRTTTLPRGMMCKLNDTLCDSDIVSPSPQRQRPMCLCPRQLPRSPRWHIVLPPAVLLRLA